MTIGSERSISSTVGQRLTTRYQRDPRNFSDDSRWVFVLALWVVTIMMWSRPQFSSVRASGLLSALLWTLYLPARTIVRFRHRTPRWLVWLDAVLMGINFYWWRWIPVPAPLLSVVVVWEAVWSLPMGQAMGVSAFFSSVDAIITLGFPPTLQGFWTILFTVPFYPMITILLYFLRHQFTHVTHLADHDSLTGLINRRAVETLYVPSEPLKVWTILLDLDDFKAINDHYGHIVGDQVLQAVGSLLQYAFRHESIATARYGGEEFLLLMPNTISLNKLSTQIAFFLDQLQERSRSFPRPITVSGGVVQSHCQESFNSLVSRADALLYQAKAQGKNRIQWDPTITPTPATMSLFTMPSSRRTDGPKSFG